MALLFTDFRKWILVANLLAWPIAWWMMSDWLQQFIYRTDIALWYFPVSLVVGVVLAFVTHRRRDLARRARQSRAGFAVRIGVLRVYCTAMKIGFA